MVRPRSCRVIYYFDTPALRRRHQSFGRVTSMHVCVLLEFVERFYAGIDGFQYVYCWNLFKDYMLELMVFYVCVMLEFVERLYAGIDGFNVCVLLELSDSLYAGLLQHVNPDKIKAGLN